MKKICLIGGMLQGFEVCYLAQKAGYEVHLIDKKKQVLIKDLVEHFYCFDITIYPSKLIDISKNVDAIIPVTENFDTIKYLHEIVSNIHCPILFDFDSYYISRDKAVSKSFFAKINVPTPINRPYSPPYFVKPITGSSSVGAFMTYDKKKIPNLDTDFIVEEYIEGNVISLEVIGNGNTYYVGKETKVHINESNDCYMISTFSTNKTFRKIAHNIASNLKLKGIMDVEAIQNKRNLKIIEIDARFPSQTPIVVYNSSGINLLEMLLEAFSLEEITNFECISTENQCTLEHLMKGKNNSLVHIGEQKLKNALTCKLYHADENIEIFEYMGSNKIYTLISKGVNEKSLCANRECGLNMLKYN